MRVRPTADRVKEALFSILTSLVGDFSGLRVIDIFAGSGSLGIEALSRGCAQVVFIDSHRESVAAIRENLHDLGFLPQSRIMAKEAVSALTTLEETEQPFGLVFLDPPYREGLAVKILERLALSPLVADETIVIAEFARDEDIPTSYGRLAEFDRRAYGDTALAFFQKGT
jgi:16S rRNA (guanine(966)-N(2))-methyltransferase RsmD